MRGSKTKFRFSDKKQQTKILHRNTVSGTNYVPLTFCLRAAYCSAYVAAYVGSKRRPFYAFFNEIRPTSHLRKKCPYWGFLLIFAK